MPYETKGNNTVRLMRGIVPALSALVAVAAAQTAAKAHYIWATVEEGKARFALLENIAETPSVPFEKYVLPSALSSRCGDKTLATGTPRGGAAYATLPAGESAVTAESTVGVKEREGAPYLLVYQARGAVTLAATGAGTTTMLKAPAALLARRDGEKLVVSVHQSGRPVAGGEIWVQWPGASEPDEFRTDVQGEVRTPWPAEAARRSGFVGIRTMVTENCPGEWAGRKYASVHRWATLTFGVKGTGTGADKPFTQLLRESYAGQHEVVSSSEFNKTVFAGEITKHQVILHLQQRALIHNEVHRILCDAPAALSVPYGDAQRNVLVLLFQDLIKMGSGWPTEAQARPLTAAFLVALRESEKRGPYFALGVQHVYYGGITNGGRTIGAMIGEQIKFTPTYYEKSDGYTEYLPGVNKITDPNARKEMILGGQAAYRYIIASSNDPIFKAGKPVQK